MLKDSREGQPNLHQEVPQSRRMPRPFVTRVTTLTTDGAIAASLIGVIAVVAGWRWVVLLIVFFVAATRVTVFRSAEKLHRARDVLARPGDRAAIQVIANGGVFALAGLWFAWTGAVDARAVAAGALAAASADSWATELGLLSRSTPRLITSGRRVPAGTSGGITLAGTAAGVLGAMVVAVTSLIIGWPAEVALAATLGGTSGMLADSLLGATVQERRWCSTCGRRSERTLHSCGNRTKRIGGIAGFNNDPVNFVTTAVGAGARSPRGAQLASPGSPATPSTGPMPTAGSWSVVTAGSLGT
jgi:uncharacterized protein (TIGR00297 family)